MVWDADEDKNTKVPVYVYPHVRKICHNCGGALRRGSNSIIDKRLQVGLATCMKCRRRVTSIGFYLAHKDDFACVNPSEMEKAQNKRIAKLERKKARKEARKDGIGSIKEENNPFQPQPIATEEENPALIIQNRKNEIFEIISQTNQKLNEKILEEFKVAWLKVNLNLSELDNLSSVYFVRTNFETISSIIISRQKNINNHDVTGIRFITSRSKLAETLYKCNETNTPGDTFEVIEKIYFKGLSTLLTSQEKNIATQPNAPKTNLTVKKDEVKEAPNSREDIKTVYVYFRLTNSCMKHKHQIESVTASTTNAKNGQTIHINVFHCRNCNKYFINYEALQRYIARGVYPAFPYKLSNDLSGSLNDASKLMLYGYRVAEGTLTRQERLSILTWIIDTGLLS